MDDNKHTANYLASCFLMSKRCRKKIYDLNPTKIAIIRYICDSIDMESKKRRNTKSLKTRLYQSQIATQLCTSLSTIFRSINQLKRKRIIKYNPENNIFEPGLVLTTYVNLTESKEVRQIDVGLRSTSNRRTSNSSNTTNMEQSKRPSKNQEQTSYASVENQSTSYRQFPSLIKSQMPQEIRDKLRLKRR